MLRFLEELKNFNISKFIQSVWGKLKSTLKDIFSSQRYEQEIQQLIEVRLYTKQLYAEVTTGKSGKCLIEHTLAIAKDEEKSSVERGQAYLILAHIYRHTISLPHFTNKSNHDLGSAYYHQAVTLLGHKPVLSAHASRVVAAIRAGGEAFYAFNQLLSDANTKSNNSYFSQKILSELYKKGVQNDSFVLSANQSTAEKFLQKARDGYAKLKDKIKELADVVITKVTDLTKSRSLLRSLASTEDKYAQFSYAKFLEQHYPTPRLVTHYQNAAATTEDSLLNFGEPGYEPAIQYLIKAHDTHSHGLTNTNNESTEYCLQLVNNGKTTIAQQTKNELQKKASENDVLANLQLAWHTIEKNTNMQETLDKVTDYLTNVELSKKPLNKFEQELYLKLCLQLGKLYEVAFLSEPSSKEKTLDLTARNLLQHAIYYLQKVPQSWEEFGKLQQQIAHYQHYFLQQEAVAVASLEQGCQEGNILDATQAVQWAFKLYWEDSLKNLTTKEQQIVADYNKTNKPFWDNVTIYKYSQLPAVPEKNSAKLIEEILEQLTFINNQRYQARKIPLFDLGHITKAFKDIPLRNLDDNFKSVPGLRLIDDRLPAGIRKRIFMNYHQRTKLGGTHQTFFGHKNSKPDSRVLILTVINHLLTEMINDTSKTPYSNIVFDAYLRFVLSVCDNYVKNARTSVASGISTTMLPTHAGVVR